MKEFSYLKLSAIILAIASVIFAISCLNFNHGVNPNPDWTNPMGNFTVDVGDPNFTLVIPACQWYVVSDFNYFYCQLDSDDIWNINSHEGVFFEYNYSQYDASNPDTWYYHIPIPENWTLTNHSLYIGHFAFSFGRIDKYCRWDLISIPADVEPVVPSPNVDGNNTTTNDTNISSS